MAQRTRLIGELKRLLKERGLTYQDVARRLKLSHASVKRLFSTGDFSLERLDGICALLDMELSDVVESMREREAPATRLTLEQEQDIVSDPRLFLMTWLVTNKWRFEDITRFYAFSKQEAQRYLIRLDRLRIIDLQPGNRYRLVVARNLTWRPGGPVQRYLNKLLLGEFFASDFAHPAADFSFYGAVVSEATLAQFKRVLQDALRQCMELAERDAAALPLDERHGAACVLAVRPWQYSGFDRFRRAGGPSDEGLSDYDAAGGKRRKSGKI